MAIIKECSIWANGMVISFDEKGEQIPEYGGFILDIAEKLKTGCDENTKWIFGRWGEWAQDANFNWYWEQKKKDRKDKIQDIQDDNIQDSKNDNNVIYIQEEGRT